MRRAMCFWGQRNRLDLLVEDNILVLLELLQVAGCALVVGRSTAVDPQHSSLVCIGMFRTTAAAAFQTPA